MAERTAKRAARRKQVREQRARVSGSLRARLFQRVFSWPVLASVLFMVMAGGIALLGEVSLGYSVGQSLDQPVYALVDFQVPNARQTEADRDAEQAATPSYYTLNSSALTVDRIRADLMRLYQAAVDAETIENFVQAATELKLPSEGETYRVVRMLDQETGRAQFQAWVDQLPLEKEYLIRDLGQESREPKSTTDFIRLEITRLDEPTQTLDIRNAELVPHGNQRALRGSAAAVARAFRRSNLVPVVEAVIFAAFKEQPTVVFNQERTVEAMRQAAQAVPEAMTTYKRGKPFVQPGLLGEEAYELLRRHRAAYAEYLQLDDPDATKERRRVLWQRAGLVTLVSFLSIGLLLYTGMHQPRVFEIASRTMAFMTLVLVTLLAVRLLDIRWSDRQELLYVPCLVAGGVLAIVYPRRFAMGAICIVSVQVCTLVDGSLTFLLTLLTCVAVLVYQLDEIRSRTKLVGAGAITALAIMFASLAGGFWAGNAPYAVVTHAMWAGAFALLAALILSAVLPLIERLFRVATSLHLLEWRDPTRQLLQLLQRDAPGTYTHSLMLGTLAAAACERIGANGLLAQVGALYHDIGKIHKADYFVENQTGQINRHANLAPTMSLLIILGHVKDGVEMAKEYKLPTVLHQFIEEHHGTTVIRYFHHRASEQQPQIASGKHDREVPEAEFRYAGPRPRSRESAVLMMCDGAEGAVRALREATPSRIESVVHRIVMERLDDGQFDDCEIKLKEIRLVEESLVKSLQSAYHGRVAYPNENETRSAGSDGNRQGSQAADRSGARAG